MPRDLTLVLVLLAVLIVLTASTLAALAAFWVWVRSVLRSGTIDLLDALARQERTIEALLSRLDADCAPPRDRAVAVPPSSHRPDPAGAKAGKPTLIAVPSLASAAAEGTTSASSSASASADLARRFGAIWERADAGEPADAIARATGQPVGQVELILGLRRQLTPTRPTGGRPFAPPSGPTEPRR